MALPIIYKESDKDFNMLQTRWSAEINPVIDNPTSKPTILKDVALVIGSNVINTLLQKKLQGWKIVRQRGPANIYDQQDSNPRPELTLVLVSDAIVSIDLEIY